MVSKNNKYFNRLLLAILLLSGAFSATSQNSMLDTIDLQSVTVYQAKKNAKTHPGVKAISIDTLVIKEKKGLSLSELLIENSPLFIKTYGRGATATASFRGTSASHTNVYWNGLKINSPMSGEADFSLIPLYFIDDVAIHFGQSSMGFGSGGLGGSVNLASQPDWSQNFGAKLYQSVGSYNTYSTAANVTYGKSRAKAQTRVFRETSENNFTYQNTAKIGKPTEIQQNADYLKYGLLQEFYFRPNSNHIVSSKIWLQDNQRGIPKLMSSFSVDEHNRQNDQTLHSVVEWRGVGNSLSWKANTGVSHINLDYIHEKQSTEGNPLPVIEARSKSWSWYNKVVVGTDILSWLSFQGNLELNKHWVSSGESIMESGYKGEQTHSALRLNLNAKPTQRLHLALLVSEELHNKTYSPISYSLSGEYKLFKKRGLFAKAAVSRNYKHPSLNDLYWEPGGNKDLKPENGYSWEAGIKHAAKQGDVVFDMDVNLFSSSINNWIMWLPHLKGYWEPVNLDMVKIRGAELSLSGKFSVGNTRIQAIGNYSFTRSTIENAGDIMRQETHGNQLPFIPVHSGGLAINMLWRSFHLVYSFTHFSERFTTTSNNPNSFRRLYPYYMNSAALGKDFKLFDTSFGMQLRVDNLLDESYQTILWRPMPGRNYNLVIRLTL
ncbi:MAG: TonB-dependent receptor domain-containing protein [Bacteroidales bacterium]